VILAVVVALEETLVLFQLARRLVPHHWNRCIYTSVHEAKVTSHGNVLEPLEAHNSSIRVEFRQLDLLIAVKFVVEILKSSEGTTVAAESKKKNSLNIPETPLSHRVETDVEDHILIAKELFDSFVEEDQYVGRNPIIRVSKKLLDIHHPVQFFTQVLKQRLYQRRITLLNVVDDGFSVDTAIVSFHGPSTQKRKNHTALDIRSHLSWIPQNPEIGYLKRVVDGAGADCGSAAL
jgi:hypothetical protein